jgi:multicomponent Na+:H+ antiporter subunit D
VYGTAGTVNMAELSRRVAEGGLPAVFWAALALVLVVFAIKTALVPLFFWLPDAYPEAPIPVSGLFAGLLTKVGVYTLFRTVPLVTGAEPAPFHAFLASIAAATMLVGCWARWGATTSARSSRSTSSPRWATWSSAWRSTRRWPWRRGSSTSCTTSS